MSFTSWNAAESALVRLGAERVYKCSGCGYLHITRYTEGEYSQRIADTDLEGCTSGYDYGIVVDTNQGGHHEEQAGEGGEPASRGGDARQALVARSGSSRLAPSPVEVARLVAQRRHP